MQSNSALSPFGFQPDPKAQADKLAKKLNLTYANSKDLIQKLTEVDAQKIVDAETPIIEMGVPSGMHPFEFVPTAEPKGTKDAILTEPPISKLLSGNFKKIPLIIGNTNFESMFFTLSYKAAPQILSLYNSNPFFMLPISFEMTPDSKNVNELLKELQNLYFGGKSEGTVEEWLQYFNDGMFRTTQNRVANFYANSSSSPIYYYEFAFDGSLNFYKQIFGLNEFKGASHVDDVLYLFEKEDGGLKADERSKMMRSQMVKMWTNFAKYG
jgi:carboxylesterase type B